jgi:ubiquinone/menaquinone biosynthesis C-methylase UbiE
MSETQREKTRVAYDLVAESYARLLPDTNFEAALDLAMIDAFLERLERLGAPTVLDAGCGAGRMMTYVTTRNPSLTLTGVDLSNAMVRLARAAHPEAHVVEGDLAVLPFDDAQFDGVLAWYAIIHSAPADLASIFAEFARVLRPGGIVLLAFQAGEGTREMTHAYGHAVELRAFLHNSESVIQDLEHVGFELEASLDRKPRDSETHSQGFIIARRS